MVIAEEVTAEGVTWRSDGNWSSHHHWTVKEKHMLCHVHVQDYTVKCMIGRLRLYLYRFCIVYA